MLKRTSLVVAFAIVLLFIYTPHRIRLTRQPVYPQTIGISLTMNHATVSRRHINGTFEDLGRTEGNSDYVDLMKRLSDWTSYHPSPPYQRPEDKTADWPRQLKRAARKAIGLPASADVGTIASILKPLLELAQSTDNSALSGLISFPALPGLYQEDILDAAYYVGLPKPDTTYGFHPHSIVAAYAGNGLGLYEDRDSSSKCKGQPTLLVEYTKEATLLHHSFMKQAIELPDFSKDFRIDLALGSRHNPEEHQLGAFILYLLLEVIRKCGESEELTLVWDKLTVMMSGNPSDEENKKVLDATEWACDYIFMEIERLADNADYIAARGAAEMTWHGLRMESMEL